MRPGQYDGRRAREVIYNYSVSSFSLGTIQSLICRHESNFPSHAPLRQAQLTWFRKEPLVHWLPGFGDDPAIAASAEQLVAAQLNTNVTSSSGLV
jgi:hypothetical protein